MVKTKGLGKGLDALLSATTPTERPAAAATAGVLQHLPIDQLQRGRYQPREPIDDASLGELADSIRAQGVIQPLVVRPLDDHTFEVVAGERRWRAAKLAGLEYVPSVVREISDQAALAIALIENLQREDLNAIEQATGLQRLIQEFSMTHQEAATAVGRSRASVTNLLRFLELAPQVKDRLAKGELEMGHARALLGLDPTHQVEAATMTVAQRLSVRAVERLVKRMQSANDEPPDHTHKALHAETQWLTQLLKREVGRDVRLQLRKDGRRTLDISFQSLEQLRAALDKTATLVDRLRATAGPRVKHQQD